MTTRLGWMMSCWLAALLMAVACGRRSNLDTSPMRTSFKSAEASLKAMAAKAVAAMKAGDLPAALNELQAIVPLKDKLTAEQAQAVQNAIAQVQSELLAASQKAAADAQKQAGDPARALPK